MSKKLSTEEFIEKAKSIHGDKYDYSEVVYFDNRTKVKIICPIHNVFEQKPIDHLSHCECPKCSNRYIISTHEFIEKAKNIHNDNYDYSLVNYIATKVKVEIICRIHKSFWQAPANHLLGQGCPKCVGKYMDNELFKEKANRIHNNKYDYSLVEYKNNKSKVKIICLIHNIFEQIPNSHLSGQGCPHCYGTPKKTGSQFIIDAQKIHDNKYDYSLVEYSGNKNKVKIICPTHNVFK